MSVGGSDEKAQGEDKKKNSLHRVRPFGCGAVVVLGEPSPFRNCSSCFSSAASSGVFGLRASISVCSAGVNCGRWRTKATSFQLSSGVPSPPNAGEAGDEYVKVGTPPIRGILRKRSFVHSFDFQSRHFRKTGTDAAERGAHWHNLARLVDEQGKIVEFHSLGFSERDRIDLVALMAAPEHHLNSKRITDCFAVSFFSTNFWFEWSSLFAFERWHSAIEFRLYLLRFIHHFSTIDTQEGVFRTRYNQYDSMAVPLNRWLRERDVDFRMKTDVIDLQFKAAGESITVSGIQVADINGVRTIAAEETDLVFVTNGSMTADKTFGSMDSAPKMDQSRKSGSWRLWEKIAAGRPEFGNPGTFNEHIEESSSESFTVTMKDPLFLELIQRFSGSEAGKGGLITFKDSSWLFTLSVFQQPFYTDQQDGVSLWWGYRLYHDRVGNYVKKTMAECTGREILEKVLSHLQFDNEKERIMATANVIPCMMPYITSQF